MFERDGVVHLHATCGTLQGASLLESFERQSDAEFLADWEDAQRVATAAGDDEPMRHLARTEAQRRMDALHRLIERAVSAPPGSVAPEPVVNIVMTAGEYEAALVEMSGGATVAAATLGDIDAKRCETSTGLAVSVRDAVIASMLGHVRRVVIDSSGLVIDLGRKRRFTGAARAAVLLGGRRCIWPGCGRHSHRNQIDHTHEHSRGGVTAPCNGGPACGRHNRLKSHGYTAHRDSQGVWHVYRPDGTELTRPAAA
jgi:hypothetical protein